MKGLEETAFLLHEVDDPLFGNHFTVDADAFAEVNEMRGCIETDPITGLLKHGCDTVRARAFAVGTCDMNRFISSVRMSKMFI